MTHTSACSIDLSNGPGHFTSPCGLARLLAYPAHFPVCRMRKQRQQVRALVLPAACPPVLLAPLAVRGWSDFFFTPGLIAMPGGPVWRIPTPIKHQYMRRDTAQYG